MGRGDDEAAAGRCSRITPANSACAAASSAVVGSSSSQSGRGATRSRASATRRFCPADSARTGKSATWARPSRASAAQPRRARAIAAEHAGPEGEILARRQRALQRVGVAEVMRLLAELGSASPPSSANAPCCERQEARRSRATGSTCRRRWARHDTAPRPRSPRSESPRTDLPSAPLEGDIVGAEAHGLPSTAPPDLRAVRR